jgi:predicted ATPase
VRITELHIEEWRNLRDVHVEVPADARLLSLVGSNGTGKTNLLELLSYAASQFGLSPGGRATQRVSPPERSGFRLVLDVSEDFELNLHEVSRMFGAAQPELVEAWDRTLTLWRLAFVPSSPPPGIPEGVAGDYVLAGGVPAPQAHPFGAAVVGSIAAKQELNHLFLDAERSYRAIAVEDQQILASSREDPDEPGIIRQRSAANSQGMYEEWIRSMLGLEHRYAAEFARAHRIAYEARTAGPAYEDPWREFREAVSHVMPHLAFDRADQDMRTLVFTVGGTEVPYHELSGGEREVAFLIGQLVRFRLRQGLLLLDEPELHLNAELLERWLAWAADNSEGQIWIATHSLEALEVAGPANAYVLERSEDGLVHAVSPLAERPVMSTLAGALGAPAFSLDRQRFVLIEGERPGRERNRFAALCPGDDYLFLEAGNCRQVVAKVALVAELARETDRIRIGGVVDRDHWDARDRTRFAEEAPVHVLKVHEIENFLLLPQALELLAQENGDPQESAVGFLRDASDRFAGLWIVQHAAIRHRIDLGTALRGRVGNLTWSDFVSSKAELTVELATLADLPDDSIRPQVQEWLASAISSYEKAREQEDLWKLCSGKQVAGEIAARLGLVGANALERRVLKLIADEVVAVPGELAELRGYVAGLAAQTMEDARSPRGVRPST